jgi:ABC-type Na+ transport system ATPase subunit NatA
MNLASDSDGCRRCCSSTRAFPRYLTARSLLEYYGALSQQPAGVVRRRAGELLGQVGLADRSCEPIGRFSKGMLQRPAVAQALVNDPVLLVLDEPSEGIDLAARRLLHKIIRERQEQGQTAILVSHMLSDVERLCNRVAVLRNGRMGCIGRVDELKRNADADEPVVASSSTAHAGGALLVIAQLACRSCVLDRAEAGRLWDAALRCAEGEGLFRRGDEPQFARCDRVLDLAISPQLRSRSPVAVCSRRPADSRQRIISAAEYPDCAGLEGGFPADRHRTRIGGLDLVCPLENRDLQYQLP